MTSRSADASSACGARIRTHVCILLSGRCCAAQHNWLPIDRLGSFATDVGDLTYPLMSASPRKRRHFIGKRNTQRAMKRREQVQQ